MNPADLPGYPIQLFFLINSGWPGFYSDHLADRTVLIGSVPLKIHDVNGLSFKMIRRIPVSVKN